MYRKNVLFLIWLAVSLGGCASNRISLTDKDLVSVKTIVDKKVAILWADVYEDDKGTVVYGVLQRRSHTSYPLKTHVNVTILSANDTILQEGNTPDIYVPRRIVGKGIDWKRFKVRFPNRIAEGSKIIIAIYSGQDEEKCRGNTHMC